jgi:hypothetical protein
MPGRTVDAEPRGMYGSENAIKPIERHTLASPPASTQSLSRKGRRFHGPACDIGSLFLNSHSSSENFPQRYWRRRTRVRAICPMTGNTLPNVNRCLRQLRKIMFDSSAEKDDAIRLERARVYGVICDTLRGRVWPPWHPEDQFNEHKRRD